MEVWKGRGDRKEIPRGVKGGRERVLIEEGVQEV